MLRFLSDGWRKGLIPSSIAVCCIRVNFASCLVPINILSRKTTKKQRFGPGGGRYVSALCYISLLGGILHLVVDVFFNTPRFLTRSKSNIFPTSFSKVLFSVLWRASCGHRCPLVGVTALSLLMFVLETEIISWMRVCLTFHAVHCEVAVPQCCLFSSKERISGCVDDNAFTNVKLPKDFLFKRIASLLGILLWSNPELLQHQSCVWEWKCHKALHIRPVILYLLAHLRWI